MRKPGPIPSRRLRELEVFRKEKWPGDVFRRYLCVWLRAEQDMNAVEIGKVVGWHPTTVRITQADFIKHGASALTEKPRGGRHRAIMTPDEEVEFLERFREQAGAGSVLVAGRLHQALEEFLGRSVSTATVYRILERNGWRKIVPRPAHPKKDPKDAEAFKKGATKLKSEGQRPSPKPKGSY